MSTYKITWYKNRQRGGDVIVDAENERDAVDLASGSLRYEYPTSFSCEEIQSLPCPNLTSETSRWLDIENTLPTQRMYSPEIAGEIRANLKAVFGLGWKFSVVCDRRGSGAPSITVSVMQAPVEIRTTDSGYMQLNHYYPESETRLSQYGRHVMNLVGEIALFRHWDKSDPMTDYSNCNFYLHTQIGKWDKPFQVAPRTK